MEMSNPLVTSEPILMQVIQSDSTNNTIKCDEEKPEHDKSSKIEQQELNTQPSSFNAMVPSEETLDRYSKQIMSFVNEQTHQGSMSFNESSRNDTSSFGNMLQTDSNSWQEVTNRSDSLEPGECTTKLDGSENPQGMNLDHIEGQVLLGMGIPEWGEVLQKDDDGRLLEMNFMGCDAEKRMLRATIIERSKEINRLQKELSSVFQIIHQLKQENEYLTQQQQLAHLQQQTPQQSALQRNDTQQQNDHQSRSEQDDQQSVITNPSIQTTQTEQQEFLDMPTTTCSPAQQNDQLLLLELLNHIPPSTASDV